jgi:RNA polymerase sigma factor (sigma-70 family)
LQSIPKYTEYELVLSLQNREEAAFSYLYDNYAGALNGIINAMINDLALAEDILQEAFLKIWRNIEHYDESKGKLFTWMRTIAHNLTLDTLKSKQYKQQNKVTSDEFAVTNIQDKNSNINSKLDSSDLKNKIEQLDYKQRTILNMSYFQGYTQEEIAKTLEMPVGTVKTKLRTAIIELRKIIN